nr:LysR family transcriptional regulator [Paenibacillus sp. SYP-B3998]
MDLYRVFYACAKTGSLTKAAGQLHVTQPAVSHSIKQLENIMGGALFSRASKGVTLTKEGNVLLEYIEQAFQIISLGEKKIAEMRQLLAGEVRIGAGDTLCRYILLPSLEAFYRKHPGIKLKVTNRTTLESVELLKKRKIDFALVNLPLDDIQLEVQKVVDVHDCFIAGPRFEHLQGRKISLNELLSSPLILLEQGSNSRLYVDQYIEQKGYKIVPEIELGSLDLLVEFARIGLGVSCIIREFVDRNQTTVFEIDLKDPIPPREIGIVKLKNIPLSEAAQMFVSTFSLV